MKYLLIALVIFVILVCLNSFSFVAVRIFGELGGGLTLIRPAPPTKIGERAVMYYVIGNPRDRSLAISLTEGLHCGVTFVEYQKLGWRPEATADLISRDVVQNSYVTKLFTISVADQVARYLESEIGSVETTTFAPCSNPSFLKMPTRIWLSIFAIIAEMFCIALGWISYSVIISTKRGRVSLALLADFCFQAAYNFPPESFNQTTGLILQERDRHLKTEYVEQFFGAARKIYLKKSQCSLRAKKEQAILEANRRLTAKIT